MKNMKGTWAVVTGASSGIGADFARQFAERGMNIIPVARRADRLEELKKDLETKYQVQVVPAVADLLKPESYEEVFKLATDGRDVQVLVNNAGMGHYGPFLNIPLEDHLRTIDLNVRALTALSYYFTQHMEEHKNESYVVNVASVASFLAVPQFGVYTGSKKYVKDFSETLNYEFQKSNIHFMCLCPGGTYTEFLDKAGQDLKGTAHKGMMKSEDVVKIAIRGMEGKKRSVVTGLLNNFVSKFGSRLPSHVRLDLAHKVMSKTVNSTNK